MPNMTYKDRPKRAWEKDVDDYLASGRYPNGTTRLPAAISKKKASTKPKTKKVEPKKVDPKKQYTSEVKDDFAKAPAKPQSGWDEFKGGVQKQYSKLSKALGAYIDPWAKSTKMRLGVKPDYSQLEGEVSSLRENLFNAATPEERTMAAHQLKIREDQLKKAKLEDKAFMQQDTERRGIIAKLQQKKIEEENRRIATIAAGMKPAVQSPQFSYNFNAPQFGGR